MPPKRKTKTSKPKKETSISTSKMEIVKITASNGRDMYFKIVNGKKKRIANPEAVTKVKPKAPPPKAKTTTSKTKVPTKAKKTVAPKAKSKTITKKEEFKAIYSEDVEAYRIEAPKGDEKDIIVFWEKVYEDPSLIKKVLDMYLDLAKKGYTGVSGGHFAMSLFWKDGKVQSNLMLEPTKGGKINFQEFFDAATGLLVAHSDRFVLGGKWIPGTDLSNDQRKLIAQNMFDLGTKILEWIRDRKPKFVEGTGQLSSRMDALDFEASEDLEKITLSSWKKFEKAVMSKDKIKDPRIVAE